VKHDSIGWVASRWHAWLHDRRAEMGGLEQAEQMVADAVVTQLAPRILPSEATDEDLEILTESTEVVTTAIGRGLYARLYGDPAPVEAGPAWARAVVQAIEAAADLDELRAMCAADADIAAIATTTVLREVAGQMPDLFDGLDEQEQDPQAEPGEDEESDEGEDCDEGEDEGDGEPAQPGGTLPGPGEGEDGEGEGGSAGGAGDGTGEGDGEGEGVQISELLAEAMRGIATGVRRAVRAAAEAKADLDGLMPGLGKADPARRDDPRRLQLLEQLRSDGRLQKILRIAGRIRRVADRVRQVPSPEMKVELSDIERGADLAQVLPQELMLLDAASDDPELEVLELLKQKELVERGLLQRRMVGCDRLGRGPIVVLLDASSSMGCGMGDGLDRMAWAAAIAIGALRAGVEETRPVSVCVFDGGVRKRQTWVCQAGDRRAFEEAILGVAGVQADGGTVFDEPIAWGLDNGAERDRADLLVVTDGAAHVSPKIVERLNESRKRGLRFWGVLAGEGGFTGVLEKISDGITEITGKDGEDSIGLVGGMGAT
jgi:uncharacterized protein with von Willebrand factor type A (vWA) domain